MEVNNLIKSSIILIMAIFLIPSGVLGQHNRWKPLFPVDDTNYKLSGWLVGAGATYTFSLPKNTEQVYQLGNDTLLTANFRAGGKLGFLVEVGRFTMTYNRFIPYLDYGLSFKQIRGSQDYTGYLSESDSQDTILITQSTASFTNYYLSAYFNANNTIRVSEFGFIQNSLGLNVDYKVIETIKGTAPIFPGTISSSEVFLVQLHYKLGYGFRLDKKHYLTFTLETPILTAFPWDDGKSTIAIFDSRYRPVLFSVRLLFLSTNSRPDCNKPTNINMNKKRNKTRLF